MKLFIQLSLFWIFLFSLVMIHCSSTDGGMRVGRDYQAQIPPLIPVVGMLVVNFIKISQILMHMDIGDCTQIVSQSNMQSEHS